MSGFYARNFIWTGPGNSRPQNATDICKGCTKALIRCGWKLDSSAHSGIDDIKERPVNNEEYSCWYKLVSKTRGAKLLVYFNHYKRTTLSQQVCAMNGSGSNSRMLCGLGLAIIPPDSDAEFGDDPLSEEVRFIPADAGYIFGQTYNGDYGGSISHSNYSGRIYEYKFVSDGEETVFVLTRFSNNFSVSYCVGKIIGTLAYPEIDTSVCAKYGAISLSNGTGDYSQQYAQLPSAYNSTSDIFINYNAVGYPSSFVFKPNGERYEYPTYPSERKVVMLPDMNISNAYICSSYNNGQRRWAALGIAIANGNPAASSEIIHGADGFKGYLDTNIFRYVGTNNVTDEQVMDSGSFLHLFNGLVIAWDASNTIKLLSYNSAIDTRNWDGGADPFAG